MSIQCPHCRRTFSGYDKERDQRAMQLGICVDCNEPKTDAEIEAGRWRCRKCRVKRSNRMAAKRGVRNEQAVRRIYAK